MSAALPPTYNAASAVSKLTYPNNKMILIFTAKEEEPGPSDIRWRLFRRKPKKTGIYNVTTFDQTEESSKCTGTPSRCCCDQSAITRELIEISAKARKVLREQVEEMNMVEAQEHNDGKRWYWVVRTVKRRYNGESFSVGLERQCGDPKVTEEKGQENL